LKETRGLGVSRGLDDTSPPRRQPDGPTDFHSAQGGPPRAMTY
jgi:hypothetical protein